MELRETIPFTKDPLKPMGQRAGHITYLKRIPGEVDLIRENLWANSSEGASDNHATMTNLIQLRTEVLAGLTKNDEANIKHRVDKWKAGSS